MFSQISPGGVKVQNRLPRTNGFLPLNAIVALTIVAGVFSPAHLFQIQRAHMATLTLADAVFGVLFLFAWRYVFSHSEAHNKFASSGRRVRSIVKGVIFMMVPTLVFVGIFHSGLLSFRSFSEMFLLLTCYEMLYVAIKSHLTDPVALKDRRRAVIVGSGRRAGKAWREIRTKYHSSIDFLGFIDDRSVDEMPPDVAQRYLGNRSWIE